MSVLIDTDVAIWLRDEPARVAPLLQTLDAPPFISVITRIELEGGVYANPALSNARRLAVDVLLEDLKVLELTESIAEIYGTIVQLSGFSRRKVSDRIIAATALAHGLSLVTLNARDFRDIRGLDLVGWELAD